LTERLPISPLNVATTGLVSEARLLWSGGGAYGSPSRLRRARHRVRTLVSEHPALYLPLARRRYPGPSPRVVSARTEAVIDGYTRCASTFAVYAFQLSQPRPVRLAHHLHAPAQLIEAARRGLPTLVVIREPRGALLSQIIREPDVDLLDALYAYRRFYVSLLPHREAFVVGDFQDVTSDFGSVVRQLNDKFGTSFGTFEATPEMMSECMRMIGQRPALSPTLLGFESGEVSPARARACLDGLAEAAEGEASWVPSPARDRAKAALEGLWSSPSLRAARSAAEEIYREFRAA